MKKKLCMLGGMLLLSKIISAQTFVINHISYTITSTVNLTVSVTNYNTTGGTVVTIPTTVIDNNISYDVKSIGTNAFNNNGLTSVSIPNGVTSIGLSAFANNNLTNIVFPNSITSIGFNSFNSNNLSSVVIPVGVTKIEGQTFTSNNISSVTLPNGMDSIGNSAFYNNNIASITIPSSMVDIDFAAFRNNPLTTVVSEAIVPPTIFQQGINDSFYNRSVIDLTIPNGTTGAYVNDPGALWIGFNSVTEAAPVLVNTISVQGQGGVSAIPVQNGTLQLEAEVLPMNAQNMFYTWSVTNGTGSATISSSGLLTAITNGMVTVIATANDASGITGSVAITISNQSTVGVNEHEANVFFIYPNPANAQLYIDSDLEINSATIISATGQIIKKVLMTGHTIDVTDLKEGVYLIQIHTDDKTISKRFLKTY